MKEMTNLKAIQHLFELFGRFIEIVDHNDSLIITEYKT